MMYTVRVASTKQEISFCLPSDQQPPQKIRLHNENTSIALFNFEKKTNSYVELTKEELESFNRGYKTGRCRHSEVVNREMGDERYNKRLAKLQRKLKEKTKNEHQCSYCEEYGGVINIQIPSSDLHVAVEDIQGEYSIVTSVRKVYSTQQVLYVNVYSTQQVLYVNVHI